MLIPKQHVCDGLMGGKWFHNCFIEMMFWIWILKFESDPLQMRRDMCGQIILFPLLFWLLSDVLPSWLDVRWTNDKHVNFTTVITDKFNLIQFNSIQFYWSKKEIHGVYMHAIDDTRRSTQKQKTLMQTDT